MSLIKGHGAKLESNERVYKLEIGEYAAYLVSNSPANAALQWVIVNRVPDKELVKAAFEAMGVKQ